MKESTEYEIQKAKHKRLLVRNEFRGVGKYDIPLMRKQRIDLDKIKFLDYTKAKINDGENAHKTVHFFMHDWKFDKVTNARFQFVYRYAARASNRKRVQKPLVRRVLAKHGA